MLVTLSRALGTLHTHTSYTFPSRWMSVTSMPDTMVAAARRMSPGLSPLRWAAARSTLTSTWGTGRWTSVFKSTSPGIPERACSTSVAVWRRRSEEHTSELQSRSDLVCRLLLEKKKKDSRTHAADDSITL